MNSDDLDLKLDNVVPTKEQTEELYNQLINRIHGISHKVTPRYEDHNEFVSNHPYRAWFLIKQTTNVLGNVYVQYDNSIGLNCVEDITEPQIEKILNLITAKFLPLEAVSSLRTAYFFLNVSSSNMKLQNKLKNLGLVESQRSFCLVKG
jgi:hypothetical protein